MVDYQALYDEKAEYVARRDPNSLSARRIELEVLTFKIPNLAEVLPALSRYDSIAEIGSATGELIANFPGQEGTKRKGFDISPLNVAAARERYPHAEFSTDDFRLAGERFDIVVLSDILEHVEDDVGFLRSAAEIADIVLLNLPIEKCWSCALRQYGPDDPSGHLRNYSFEEGIGLVRQAGLEVMRYKHAWSFESVYEAHRQELNRTVLGARFTGSAPKRALKATFASLVKAFPAVGRRYFPANLFVSARLPAR